MPLYISTLLTLNGLTITLLLSHIPKHTALSFLFSESPFFTCLPSEFLFLPQRKMSCHPLYEAPLNKVFTLFTVLLHICTEQHMCIYQPDNISSYLCVLLYFLLFICVSSALKNTWLMIKNLHGFCIGVVITFASR